MDLRFPRQDSGRLRYTKDEDARVDSGYNTTGPSSQQLDRLLVTRIAADLVRFLDYSSPVNLMERISLVLPVQSFLIMKVAMFLLIAQKPATQQDLKRLAIVIVGPNNVNLPILTRTNVSGNGILYTFRPVFPGFHSIDIFHNAIHPIRGCPLKIVFSRNYRFLTSVLDWELSDKARYDSCSPWGLCCNTKTEQLWIGDRVNHKLIVYKLDGTVDFFVGCRGTGAGKFFRPTALAYDVNSDRIFVSDKDNHRIQILNAKDGTFLATFGRKGELPGQFQMPWGVAVSPDGSKIAVADTRNHRIQFFDAAGNYLQEFPIPGPSYPRGLAFNLTGDALFISDFNLHKVHQLRLMDSKLILQPFIPPGILYRPSGIIVDEAGNVIVADTKNNSVRVFGPTGILLKTIRTIGHPLDSKAGLKFPTDVSIVPRNGFIATLDDKGRVSILVVLSL
ncbi:E3 ubiquitin-protein ligase TRIM71 [Folsomia candida]|uniref:E3 ubiquitin-protein ligase TRIM71 n=1 Tax=Folsomia candida TaxID=158441 RepID=A0A226E7V5_FOLCA|nr:E3 ubiquitin-protein ligase TRIM71 [Folsomia candida]OXA53067.1 hypothetical protein Fcan01_12623 [Folsomia candida]